MTLGVEFQQVLAELVAEDDAFGSTIEWRHLERVQDPETYEVTVSPGPTENPRVAVVDPLRLRLFSDSTIEIASTAILVPAAQLATEPAKLDEVVLRADRVLRVLELKELLGPGDGGEPVLIGYAAALGT